MNFQKIVARLKRCCESKSVRTLKDMKSQYNEQKEVKRILQKRNPIIYRVYVKQLSENVLIGLTVMNSGKVGKEYYMTKGHKHKKPYPEKYILIKGKAKLVLQDKTSKTILLKKNKPFTVPGKSAHRLVNIGKDKLEVLAIYDKRAGHDYKTKFKKRVCE